MIRQGIAAAACIIGFSSMAHAQEAFRMEPPPEPTGATPQIIGGQPASPTAWPATLRFDTPGGMCTSTVVGPRVVLTAAHCVDPGANGTIRIAGEVTNVQCFHHPGYDADYRLDVALCLAASDIDLPNNASFETLNSNAAIPSQNSPVTLLGYGCRQPGGGGPSGALYEGQSTVRRAADSDAYVETRGGAAVCFGDSGGGAYHREGAQPRRLFGVNSRGDILTRSLLTAVAHPSVMQFVQDFSTTRNVPICGIRAHAKCR